MSGSVAVEQRGNVLIATLSNPPTALMDNEIVVGLLALARRADADPDVGAVVLTGDHPTRFIAHFNVAEILSGAEQAPRLSKQMLRAGLRATGAALRVPGAAKLLVRGPLAGFIGLETFTQTLLAIESCSAVWVAALNGDTGGGGCELALACDYRFMADGPYSIAQPEIFLGFPPGGGGTQRLTRLLGAGKALHMCLEGTPKTPAEALAFGLVDRVVAPERLLEEAVEHATRLGRRPKAGIGAVKRAVRFGGSLALEDGLRLEAGEFLAAITTPDSIEAQRAYVDRTKELGDVPIANPDILAAVIERGRFV
jgi:enoyl-CoA hydratase